MLISTTTFLTRIAARTGLCPDACGRLVELTMKALAGQLCVSTVQRLSDELPPTLAVWVEAPAAPGPAGLAPMLAAGLVLEQVATVLGALAELLPASMLQVLRTELPGDLAALLTPCEQHPSDASAWRAGR